jgi:hypothetical protein
MGIRGLKRVLPWANDRPAIPARKRATVAIALKGKALPITGKMLLSGKSALIERLEISRK